MIRFPVRRNKPGVLKRLPHFQVTPRQTVATVQNTVEGLLQAAAVFAMAGGAAWVATRIIKEFRNDSRTRSLVRADDL